MYRDKDIVVINKPSGLLSVPGKGEEKQDCAEARVRKLFPEAPLQCAVHRLDMETSGILVLALNQKTHSAMNEQFAGGQVHKKYIALLDGILHGKPEGRTELPFRLDQITDLTRFTIQKTESLELQNGRSSAWFLLKRWVSLSELPFTLRLNLLR